MQSTPSLLGQGGDEFTCMIQDLPKRQCCWTDRAAVHLEQSSLLSFLIEIHEPHPSIKLETVFFTTGDCRMPYRRWLFDSGVESSRHSATRL